MKWRVALENGHYGEAYSLLQNEMQNNDTDIDLIEAMAICCYHLGNLFEAEKYFLQVMEMQPSLDRLYNIIKVKSALAKHSEVLFLASRYLEKDPNNFAVLDMLGDSCYYLEKYQESVTCYEKAYRLRNEKIIAKKADKAREKMVKQKERERLEKWAEDFYIYSRYGQKGRERQNLSFPYLFKDQIIEYKIMEKLLACNITSLRELKVLEVGCGEGRWLRKLIDWGAQPQNLVGIDLNADIIALARSLAAPGIVYNVAHADNMPYEDKAFDIILSIGVLQHILQPMLQQAVGSEMLRVLKDDGIIITINFNKRGWGINDVSMKARISAIGISQTELELFFPGCIINYEDALLSDPVIHCVIPDQWGKLYDMAVDQYAINHGFGIAVIKKRK